MKTTASLTALVNEILGNIRNNSEFGYTSYEDGVNYESNFASAEDGEWLIELEYNATEEECGCRYGYIIDLEVYSKNRSGDIDKVSQETYHNVYEDIKNTLEQI